MSEYEYIGAGIAIFVFLMVRHLGLRNHGLDRSCIYGFHKYNGGYHVHGMARRRGTNGSFIRGVTRSDYYQKQCRCGKLAK